MCIAYTVPKKCIGPQNLTTNVTQVSYVYTVLSSLGLGYCILMICVLHSSFISVEH